MANILSVKNPINLNLFGVDARVDLTFDRKYTMKSNSVVAVLTHQLQRSQTLIDVHALKLTQTAKDILMNDPIRFRQLYGNYFVAGFTDGCNFDVKIEREVGQNSTKRATKLNMKIEFNSLFRFNSSTNVDHNKFSAINKTNENIEIVYTGHNAQSSLPQVNNHTELFEFVRNYPKHCTGSIDKYIVFSYTHLSDFTEAMLKANKASNLVGAENEQENQSDVARKTQKYLDKLIVDELIVLKLVETSIDRNLNELVNGDQNSNWQDTKWGRDLKFTLKSNLTKHYLDILAVHETVATMVQHMLKEETSAFQIIGWIDD